MQPRRDHSLIVAISVHNPYRTIASAVIIEPSVDHAGSLSNALVPVRGTSVDPTAFITQMSGVDAEQVIPTRREVTPAPLPGRREEPPVSAQAPARDIPSRRML